MHVVIHRDCDTLRLRKVVIEVCDDQGHVLDRTRMFGLFLAYRLPRRIERMKKRAALFQTLSH